MSMITDGTGSNYRAEVTNNNRLKVEARTEDTFIDAAENGRAFNINTEAVTYTGVAPFTKGCIYVKNNESTTLEVVGWFIGEYGNRSGGNTTAPLLFKMYGNPTGAITGTDVDIVNRQIGSANTFNVDAIKEPVGWNVSGSPLLYQYHTGGRAFGTVNFSIPSGQSIIITVHSEADSIQLYTGFTGFISESTK